MKRIAAVFCTLSAFAIISCNDAANTNTPKGDTTTNAVRDSPTTLNEAPAPMPDSAAMDAAMKAYGKPGDMHKLLASQNGTWTHETSGWMDPSKPPTVTKGKAVFKMIMGGRYQQCNYTGSYKGEPFEGISTTGYDNTKKKFVSTWVDNMSTGVMVTEGDYDPASKTMKLSGKMVDPVSGKECSARQTVVYQDDKHHTMEMYVTPAGMNQEFKVMEIKYTKQ